MDIGKYDFNITKRYIDEMNKGNEKGVFINKNCKSVANKSNLKELARKFIPYFASDNG